jgi:hypothetical protein
VGGEGEGIWPEFFICRYEIRYETVRIILKRGRGYERVTARVSLIKEPHMFTWKYHSKSLFQLIYANKGEVHASVSICICLCMHV